MEKKEERIVWIKCRAISAASGRTPCSGQKAVVEKKTELGNPNLGAYSGNISRYRCTTCGRLFII